MMEKKKKHFAAFKFRLRFHKKGGLRNSVLDPEPPSNVGFVCKQGADPWRGVWGAEAIWSLWPAPATPQSPPRALSL